jgi:hypothetical protein
MTINIGCPACGRTLHVADEHAGKQIRCPACQQISIAPAMSGNIAAAEPSGVAEVQPTATSWHVRTPEGPIYGPIGWDEVLAWAAEGRIAADCELAESGNGPWRNAAELMPQLPTSTASPVCVPAGPAVYPWTPSLAQGSPYAAPGGYAAPHRGGLILAISLMGLGLIGICPVLSPIASLLAWVMGSHDLREMRAGRMDRQGENLTMIGMILGMILSLIWIIVAIALMSLLFIAFASRL